MNIQHLIARIEDRVRNSQGNEVNLPKAELIEFIERGESQLEGLFKRIKSGENKVKELQDRVASQRTTIARLTENLQAAQQVKKVNSSGQKEKR